jgi:hypothetical protein
VADKDQMRRDERDAEQRERELRKQDREMAKADEEARVQRELEHGSDPYAAEGVQTFYSDVKTPKPEEVEPEDVAPEGDDGGYNAARAKQREYLSRRAQAVSVHHQLGEQARAEGIYPGMVVPLHQDGGMDAMLGAPGEYRATAKDLAAKGIDPNAEFLIVRPVGKASRWTGDEKVV